MDSTLTPEQTKLAIAYLIRQRRQLLALLSTAWVLLYVTASLTPMNLLVFLMLGAVVTAVGTNLCSIQVLLEHTRLYLQRQTRDSQ